MKKIKTENAVGFQLVQDITRIEVGKSKGRAFKRGHIIETSDIEKLLALGKEHVYVLEDEDACLVHEEEAAEALWRLCESPNIECGEVQEGKIEAFSKIEGLLKVDVKRLTQINSIGELAIVTKLTNQRVKKGDKLAGMRCIPLFVDKAQLEEANLIGAQQPLLEVKPFIAKKVALIITGTEVFEGRIKEAFTPLVVDRIEAYHMELIYRTIVPDEKEKIEAAIHEAHRLGAEIIFCTGGMSVDPDDLTPGAIKACATDFVAYGLPILPGSMFCISYLEDKVPLIGLPGGVLFSKPSAFDIFLPRFAAKDYISREECQALGHGGLL